MNVLYGIPDRRRIPRTGCARGGSGKKGTARRGLRETGVLFVLAVLMTWGNSAFAATIANHMDYPAEGFSLWCQDADQRWVERKLTGHLDMEQHVTVPLPDEPCLFLEADMGEYLLSFPVKQELQPDDTLDMGCMPDPTLEVYRSNEPLFIADGAEKDRDLVRDPDRNPPEILSVGGLLDTFRGGMSEEECLKYGIPLRRERYNGSQNFSIKTSLNSEGVIWHGVISLYKDSETGIIGLSLTTPLSRKTLETLFSMLSAKAYRHTMLGDDGPVYPDEPLLHADAAIRTRAVGDLLAQLADPNADPYDAHFEPGSPECREKDAAETSKRESTEKAEKVEKIERAEKQELCRELGVDIRIAPGSDRIELFLQEGEEPAE